ncbi:MAG: M48 family metallopeptidase [Pseudomonadota bacterium]
MRLPRPEFNILLFGPDLPAAGLRGRAHFEDAVLVLHGRGHWYTAPVASLALKTGGFDGRQWLVAWESPLGTFTAILEGEGAMETFVDQAPEALAGRLHLARRQHRGREHRFRLALAIAGVALFLPVFALVWFWLNADRFSQWAAEQVPVEQEVRLGEMAFAQMRGGLKLLPEDAPADELVERIGVRLTVGSAYPYHFHVADDPRVNAFALPGGHVVVFTGLLKAADCADEVAGVLAHEVSHVESRHSLRNLIHALGLRAVMAVALGDFAGGVWGDMAGELAGLAYGRDLERQADLDGLRLLRRSGLPGDGMARFFEKLAAQDGEGIDLLSSHPASKERLRELRAALDAQGDYPQQSLRVDWLAVKAGL